MNENIYFALLAEHDIKPTANRIIITKALSAAEGPMSLSELENKIISIDKSSISRALHLFKEKHMVHTIEDGSDSVKYELCLSHDSDKDEDAHVHFYCEQCHKTFCMEDTPVPSVTLPLGFVMTSTNYIIKGICEKCSHRATRK